MIMQKIVAAEYLMRVRGHDLRSGVSILLTTGDYAALTVEMGEQPPVQMLMFRGNWVYSGSERSYVECLGPCCVGNPDPFATLEASRLELDSVPLDVLKTFRSLAQIEADGD